MIYQVELTKLAVKQIATLPTQEQNRIQAKIALLSENQRPPGTKKLQGSDNLYRLRQGDYRIIYEINDGELLVLVIEVAHRRDIYRQS